MAVETSEDPFALPILARGEGWVVVAKPPRLLVHRAKRARHAQHFALQLLRDQLGTWVYPIHRLDRPTSGCLLFGTEQALVSTLQQSLIEPDARKHYLAFVRGAWNRGEDVVRVDNPMKDDNKILKDAVTEVSCLGASEDPRCSLLLARPRTGRFHQVRRHVRDLGHPVLGDGEHGDSRVNRWWREERGLRRLGLHCVSVDLPLPDGTRIRATCPLYEDHHAVWRDLPWWPAAVARHPALALSPLALPEYLDPHDPAD